MHASVADYGTADVERLIGLSATALRSLVRQHYVAPARGARGALRFSFQDLIALRTAQALGRAGLSTRRITRALRELRRHLPTQLPLSGLSIRAGGEHVVVRQGGAEWEGGSGQYLLALEVSVGRAGLRLSDPSANNLRTTRQTSPPPDAESLFIEALSREDAADIADAMVLYRRCLRADPRHADARVNLARLLQEAGQIAQAKRLYLHDSCSSHALAQFNLAVLLEEQGHLTEAIAGYLHALSLEPGLVDAHYNLARLYELQGDAPHTIRHLHALQRLDPVIRD